MKKLTIAILVLFFTTFLFGQENIGFVVSKDYDTIDCTMIDVASGGMKIKYIPVGEKKAIKKYVYEIESYFKYPKIDVNIEYDDFTGKTTTKTIGVSVGTLEGKIQSLETGLNAVIYAISKNDSTKYYIRAIPFIDLGCGGSNKNYIAFKFEDGSILEFDKDLEDIDCGAFATSLYRIKNEQVNKFLETPVSKIRIRQSESRADYIVNWKPMFKELFKAVIQ